MSASPREELKALLKERSYRYSPDAPFTLASGKQSPFYFNCKAVTLSGRGLNLMGPVLLEVFKTLPGAAAVGGLTLGADALAMALASHATAGGEALDSFVIRKEAKGHGTRKWVEGELAEGARVVILDDVCTTGGSTVKAIERATECGLKVVGALVLIDRKEEDGMANIEAALKKVGAEGGAKAVYTVDDFLDS